MNSNSIAAFLHFATRHIERSRSQILQDLWVLWECGPGPGTFLDIGAADGEYLSNSWLLEQCGWTGALVEPNHRYYPKLARRRSPAFMKAAWSRSGETVELRSVIDNLEFSRLTEAPVNDMHEARGVRDRFETDRVETITLADLVAEAALPELVDYLSIDIEGAELEVLSAVDFSRHRFRCITVEHNETPARAKIHDLLATHGYRRKWTELSAWDDWYVLDAEMAPPAGAQPHALARLRDLWQARGQQEQAKAISNAHRALKD
jgi:FkbM family methyltransferase